AMAVGGLVWVLYGYGLSSGDSIAQIVGNPMSQLGLTGAVANDPETLISIGYGSTFAMIAIAPIAGAVAARAKFSTWLVFSFASGSTFSWISIAFFAGACADRAKFSPWLVFSAAWVTLVYCPLAFMVWGDGLLSESGAIGSLFVPAIDFAGGTVVHINAGI